MKSGNDNVDQLEGSGEDYHMDGWIDAHRGKGKSKHHQHQKDKKNKKGRGGHKR